MLYLKQKEGEIIMHYKIDNEVNNDTNQNTVTKKKSKYLLLVFIGIVSIMIIVAASIIINQLSLKSSNIVKPNEFLATEGNFAVIVNEDGTVNCIGENSDNYDLSEWSDIEAVEICNHNEVIVGLKNDGKVVAATTKDKMLFSDFINDISKWKNIVSICSDVDSDILVGLKTNGTVVASVCDTESSYSIPDLSYLKDIVQIEFDMLDDEWPYIVALKKDGTLESLLCDEEDEEYCDMDSFNEVIDLSEWENIKSVYLNDFMVFGITKSGEFKTTLNSEVLEKYCLRPQLNVDVIGEAACDQMINVSLKMFDDMIDRIEQMNVIQIATPDQLYEWQQFDYIDLSNEEIYLYLLLDDGTIVAESPNFSLYYVGKDLSGDALYNKVNEYAHVVFDYDDFFESWNEYCDTFENINNDLSIFQNITAINLSEDNLFVLKSDGTVYVTDITDVKGKLYDLANIKSKTISENNRDFIPDEEKILGTWKMDISAYGDGMDSLIYQQGKVVLISFYSDGTCTVGSGVNSESGEWDIIDGKLRVQGTTGGMFYNYNGFISDYNLEDDMLIVYNNGDSYVYYRQ